MTIFVLACFWVIAATIVACLPMRFQFGPGFLLLLLAPVLILFLGLELGWWVGLIALFAFVSMFRKPLAYYARKFTGTKPGETPEEET